jgi:hypothetical protein
MKHSKQAFWVLAAAVLAVLPALAQNAPPAARWINPGGNQASGGARGGNSGGHSDSQAGNRGGHAGHAGGTTGAARSIGVGGFGIAVGSAPTGAVTDPSFAGRLGSTVGGLPPATGFGNINHPGIHPGLQPLPTTSGFPIPNINSPGATPGIHRGGRLGRGGDFKGGHANFGGYGSTVYYAIPYYVPVYTEVPVYSQVAPPVEQPRPYDIRVYEGAPSPPQQAAPRPEARPVTLLAFKDSTVIAVVDYWIEGNMLIYSTSLGVRTVVPLDRVDFALTQQLNFERNVPFVLEARP